MNPSTTFADTDRKRGEMKLRIIYGGVGSGKSSYACSQIDVRETFKLGIEPGWLAVLYTFRLDIGKSHEVKNRALGLRFGVSTIDTIVKDISAITDPTLLIDEWTGLFTASLTWSPERIRKRANEIFMAIDHNSAIDKAIVVAVEFAGPTMFRLYKKLGLWNALLFAQASEITRVDYGVPISVKR